VEPLNVALFEWIGAGYTPDPKTLYFASMVAGRASWLCMALMGWAAWRRPAQRAYVMAILVAAACAALLAHALADAIDMPRPFVLGLSPAHIAHGARGSLPSAHACVMFTVALGLLLRPALRDIGLLIAAIAVLTGWARIYVGVHFPLDIVAGLSLACVIAALLWALGRLNRRLILPLIARDDARRRASTGPA
jgi:membrane-associated phospholipid phosphatase